LLRLPAADARLSIEALLSHRNLAIGMEARRVVHLLELQVRATLGDGVYASWTAQQGGAKAIHALVFAPPGARSVEVVHRVSEELEKRAPNVAVKTIRSDDPKLTREFVANAARSADIALVVYDRTPLSLGVEEELKLLSRQENHFGFILMPDAPLYKLRGGIRAHHWDDDFNGRSDLLMELGPFLASLLPAISTPTIPKQASSGSAGP
jgi:hypothetical protein